jgi:ABC-type multidrug transport system ATPase subunit
MAEMIVATLRNLADKGCTVMCTLHSPSSEMVSQFSHLLLMTSNGRQVFHGTMGNALTFLETQG